ncbi:hypothetical protein V5O48_016918, partial [Marasmius crinis-equi]
CLERNSNWDPKNLDFLNHQHTNPSSAHTERRAKGLGLEAERRGDVVVEEVRIAPSSSVDRYISNKLHIQGLSDGYLIDSEDPFFSWRRTNLISHFEDYYLDFMQMIAAQSRRWKSLSLSHLPLPFFQSFRTLTAVDLPLLETVRLLDRVSFQDTDAPMQPINTSAFNLYDHPIEPNSPIISVIQQSPAIQSLRIELQQQSDLDGIILPWSRLTVIDLRFYAPHDGFYVLQRLSQLCPSVVNCSLVVEPEAELPISNSGPSTEWTHLHDLNLIFMGNPGEAYDSEIHRTFDAITTPALIHLSVRIGYGYHTDQNEADCTAAVANDVPFHSLIERSQCQLLTLDINILLGPKFSKTLHSLPSLKSLTIHPLTRRITPNFSEGEDAATVHIAPDQGTIQLETVLEALTPLQGRIACPELEHIQLCLRPNQAESFFGLVDARATCTSRLKTFTASFGILAQADIDVVKSAQRTAESRELGVPIGWKFVRDTPKLWEPGCQHLE